MQVLPEDKRAWVACGMSCNVCMDDDAIHPFVQIEPCGHSLCVLCARECSAKQGTCPFCRGRIRKISRASGGDELAHVARCSGGWWCYQARRRGTWWAFDHSRQEAIRRAQENNERRFVLSMGILSVEIDMDAMTQTVIRGDRRSARARTIAFVSDASHILGVAGLPKSVAARTTT